MSSLTKHRANDASNDVNRPPLGGGLANSKISLSEKTGASKLLEGHSGLAGRCFRKKMKIELALLMDSLDLYRSGKNEIRLRRGCLVHFLGGWKWHVLHFKGENDLLHIISKSNQEYRVWASALIFIANLDIVTYVCVAVFCGNAYFGRNATIKMAKFDQICFFSLYINITPIFWT